jgi:K+-dependent Na+/Ca+ exchanger-like protein
VSLYLAVPLLLLSFLVIGVVTEQYFIPALENVARRLRLSDSVAGATLLAFGSSAPELFTATLTIVLAESEPAFGVGNIVGSALFQILVVIGFAAVVRTSYLSWRPVLRDGLVYGLAVLMLYAFVRDGVLTVVEACVLVLTYVGYAGSLLLWARRTDGPVAADARPAAPQPDRSSRSGLGLIVLPARWLLHPIPDPAERPAWTVPVFLLSLAIIGAGTWVFVRAGVDIARALGIDPTIVALTIIAGGSSAPELVSSAIVARRGRGDMAIANALGSNSFDIFISLGLPVLIATLLWGDLEDVGGANITSSTLLLFATLVMVIGLLAAQRFKATRPFGVLLMLAYCAYVVAAYEGWIG